MTGLIEDLWDLVDSLAEIQSILASLSEIQVAKEQVRARLSAVRGVD